MHTKIYFQRYSRLGKVYLIKDIQQSVTRHWVETRCGHLNGWGAGEWGGRLPAGVRRGAAAAPTPPRHQDRRGGGGASGYSSHWSPYLSQSRSTAERLGTAGDSHRRVHSTKHEAASAPTHRPTADANAHRPTESAERGASGACASRGSDAATCPERRRARRASKKARLDNRVGTRKRYRI